MTDAPAITYRVTELERRVGRIEAFEPAVLVERINALHDDNAELRRRVQSLQARVLGLALSIAGGSVILLLTQSGVFH